MLVLPLCYIGYLIYKAIDEQNYINSFFKAFFFAPIYRYKFYKKEKNKDQNGRLSNKELWCRAERKFMLIEPIRYYKGLSSCDKRNLSDKNFILRYLKKFPREYIFIDESLKSDLDVLFTVIGYVKDSSLIFPSNFWTKKELALKAIDKSHTLYELAGNDLIQDEDFIIKLAKGYPEVILEFANELDKHKEAILVALENNPYLYKYLFKNKELMCNPNILHTVLTSKNFDERIIENFPEDFSDLKKMKDNKERIKAVEVIILKNDLDVKLSSKETNKSKATKI